jgi:hypothetical protein
VKKKSKRWITNSFCTAESVIHLFDFFFYSSGYLPLCFYFQAFVLFVSLWFKPGGVYSVCRERYQLLVPTPVPDFLVGGLGQSLNNLFRDRFNTFRVGFQLQLPLRNRTAEGQLAELQRATGTTLSTYNVEIKSGRD